MFTGCAGYRLGTREDSTGWLLKQYPKKLIRAALSETKYQNRMGRITKSRGAFFTDQLRRLAQERGIELGLKLPRYDAKLTDR